MCYIFFLSPPFPFPILFSLRSHEFNLLELKELKSPRFEKQGWFGVEVFGWFVWGFCLFDHFYLTPTFPHLLQAPDSFSNTREKEADVNSFYYLRV